MKAISALVCLVAVSAPCLAVECPPGYYTDGTDVFPAQPGFYVPLTDSTTQTACSLGHYTPV
jgi:hypothetical protein